MREITLVFIGGGLGSIVRFILSKVINTLHSQPFPWGTLAVNIIACFLLGLFIGVADHRQLISPAARLFWTVGFCGGFSTFSTFSHETLYLLQNGFTGAMALYIISSLILCVLAIYGGLLSGEML